MIYPNNFESKIGFDTIRMMLKGKCLCELGEKLVDEISFSNDYNKIHVMLNQTEEFRQILLFSESFPSQNYFDLTPSLVRIKLEGTSLETEELFDLRSSITTIVQLLSFFKKKESEKYPYLIKLCSGISIEKTILDRLERIIDDKGQIRDNASEELKRIRTDLFKSQREIDKKIGQTLLQAKKAGWTEKDVEVTIRNGRMVIPVSATNKRKIKGFIHDESATGQTVFIEPEEVFDANNAIRELINAEKREIRRILMEFTNFLRPQLDDIRLAYEFLGKIDFIRAKAKLAIEINAVKPVIRNVTIIDWKQAMHPLLYLSFRSHKKSVVPLDIKLDEEERILVISGPNAGGKSVCLKTIGLLQYMFQCGLLLPMKEISEAGIFKSIFIDIGDEQSIENDLSTYSSHLMNMKFFSVNSNTETLFLIDEFGTGTEPILGGAIAEAILERLNENGAYGVVTTHYSNLKLLADKQEGVFNGAMTFDVEKMTPLFKLKTGKPGSSFAFEIAKNIGLGKDILERASEKTGKTQLDFDKQLQQLEQEKEVIDKKSTELKVADEFFSEVTEKYQKLTEDLEKKKSQIIEEAKAEAKKIIERSNKLIENTIKEIRESLADKEKTKRLRERVSKEKEKILDKQTFNEKTKQETPKKKVEHMQEQDTETNEKVFKPEVGMLVKIKGQNTTGEISEITGKKAIIITGSMSIKVSLDNIEKAGKKTILQKPKRNYSEHYASEINAKMANFKPAIDVRGKRADEIISVIQNYIDDAIFLNVKEVSILHGKGDGVLRKIIREYLAGVQEVTSYEDEHVERGGHGITVVTLR